MFLSYLQGMFILGEICPISEAKIRKGAEKSTACSLSSDKALCLSQSEPALYGNFTILIIPKHIVLFHSLLKGTQKPKYPEKRFPCHLAI